MRIIRTPLSLAANLIAVFIVYEICRIAFILENWSIFSGNMSWQLLTDIHSGSWKFDISAILYTNALYILLMIIPLHYKETVIWQRVTKWIYLVCNGICIAANLCDCVYFSYTGRRTTATVFQEFSNENNLGTVFGVEFLRHWYLVLLFILLMWGLWKCYKAPQPPKGEADKRAPSLINSPFRGLGGRWLAGYYIVHLIVFALTIPLCVAGMRGGFTTAVRPITISNANQYADRPQEAAIVLNTPFSLIRTFDKKIFEEVNYMPMAEAEKIYSPVHTPADSIIAKQKNIVILIVESFGREYIGGYNDWLEDGNYKGYTPFVDSLMQKSLTFKYSYCNGRKSIDGMPSILSSIPMFVEPFFLTPASMNNVSGIANELKSCGYYSAFFHGAENGSMGFQAFARTTGFDDYFGRTEFNQDKRFNGDADFDGTWAIWDEPFLQYYALTMSNFKQPFVSALFTASSHHPYVVPEKYKDTFKEEGIIIHKCIRYTDYAIKRFFETAKKQPWYNNTIFVLTSDHTNLSDHYYYQTDLGGFCSPIIFFDPNGEMENGMKDAIAQQIDIMPTLLNYLGYKKPYIAFGKDLINTPEKDCWAVNYLNGIYQYVKGNYLLQFDGKQTTAVYDFKNDLLLKKNLKGKVEEQTAMEKELKSIIQQYMFRMIHNKLNVTID